MQRNKHFIQTLYVETNTLAKSYDKKNSHCMWKRMIVCLNTFKTNCSLHVETYGCKANHFTVLFTVARICI